VSKQSGSDPPRLRLYFSAFGLPGSGGVGLASFARTNVKPEQGESVGGYSCGLRSLPTPTYRLSSIG